MAVRGGHEVHIVAQEGIRVVPAGRVHGPDQHPDTQQIEGVVPGPQAMVVVHVRPAPEVFFSLQDHPTHDLSLLGAASGLAGTGQGHDGVRMLRPGVLVVADGPELSLQCGDVVVPVHRHRQRIAYKQAPECPAHPLCYCQVAHPVLSSHDIGCGFI